MRFPSVTIAVINYNGAHFLEKCFSSIFDIEYPSYSVLMVDNASTDDSIPRVRKLFPSVEIHRLPRNNGPNPARNFALLRTGNRYCFLLDYDAIVTKACLAQLMRVLVNSDKAAICSPLVVSARDPSNIQYGPVHIHYVGAAIFDKPKKNGSNGRRVFISTTVHGTALLVDNHRAQRVGMFDEDLFFGWEDGEYTFRLTAAGKQCLVVENGRVLHNVKRRDDSLYYHQIKNRWIFILKNYSTRSIFLLLPAILFYDVMLFGFCLVKGAGSHYVRALIDVLKSFPILMKKRRKTLSQKTIGDSVLLRSGDFTGSYFLPEKGLVKRAVSIVNLLLDMYWVVAKQFIK